MSEDSEMSKEVCFSVFNMSIRSWVVRGMINFYTCSACSSACFILVLRVFYTCSACSYYSFFTRYHSEISGGGIILYVDLISYLDNFVISVHRVSQ